MLPLVFFVWRPAIGIQIGLIAIGVTSFLAFSFLANIFLRQARRKITMSLNELLATDPRRPVLFLRSFREDQAVLPRPSHTLLGKVLALGLPPQTLDELLLDEGTLYGPVVALGNPQDLMPPYGAARGYFSNKDWTGAVVTYAATRSRS